MPVFVSRAVHRTLSPRYICRARDGLSSQCENSARKPEFCVVLVEIHSSLRMIHDRNLDYQNFLLCSYVVYSRFRPDYPSSRRSAVGVDCCWLNLSGRMFGSAVPASQDIMKVRTYKFCSSVFDCFIY
jgi:hypothetical protein